MLGSNDYGWTPGKAKCKATFAEPTYSASLREIQILQARALRWVIDFMPTSHNCACALTVKWKAEALERGDITVPNDKLRHGGQQ
jgi:hypothetical protein